MNDTTQPPSHCGKCKYFKKGLFETTTSKGHDSFHGTCKIYSKSGRLETLSRYKGCGKGEHHEKYQT